MCLCLTGNFGGKMSRWTCGWLMSAGCSLCCGVQGPAPSPPTPATSWGTWRSLTGSWWATRTLALSAATPSLACSFNHPQSVQDFASSKNFLPLFYVLFFNVWQIFTLIFLHISVIFYLHGDLDFSGHCVCCYNDCALRPSAVSWTEIWWANVHLL